jgi:hypothetical protein
MLGFEVGVLSGSNEVWSLRLVLVLEFMMPNFKFQGKLGKV